MAGPLPASPAGPADQENDHPPHRPEQVLLEQRPAPPGARVRRRPDPGRRARLRSTPPASPWSGAHRRRLPRTPAKVGIEGTRPWRRTWSEGGRREPASRAPEGGHPWRGERRGPKGGRREPTSRGGAEAPAENGRRGSASRVDGAAGRRRRSAPQAPAEGASRGATTSAPVEAECPWRASRVDTKGGRQEPTPRGAAEAPAGSGLRGGDEGRGAKVGVKRRQPRRGRGATSGAPVESERPWRAPRVGAEASAEGQRRR